MKRFYTLILLKVVSTALFAQQLAFPNAEGFGRFASGGRGGSIYRVTNLNDAGPGSFRDAVSSPKRTVIFDVSGVIRIKNKIRAASDLTIAGQTSPGQGVIVYGDGISFSGNTIVRYMCFRGSIEMPRGACTVNIDSLDNIILDHVSIEWGRWDNLHIKHSTHVTLQNCLVAESLDPQCFGALIERPDSVTIHHCLWADNQSRNPKAKAKIEYINNVVYNWGSSGFVGGHSAEDHWQDLVNNYFIAGPSSSPNFLAMFTATDHVFHRGNLIDMNKDGKLNGQSISTEDFAKLGATMLTEPSLIPKSNVKIYTPEEAYKMVVAQAGSSLHRDAVDTRIIGYVTSLGKTGKIYKSEEEVGGQPTVEEKRSALKDSDADGIPDTWKIGNEQQAGSKGYTNLEQYINSLVK